MLTNLVAKITIAEKTIEPEHEFVKTRADRELENVRAELASLQLKREQLEEEIVRMLYTKELDVLLQETSQKLVYAQKRKHFWFKKHTELCAKMKEERKMRQEVESKLKSMEVVLVKQIAEVVNMFVVEKTDDEESGNES